MSNIIIFILGMMFGGTFATLFMCCLQIDNYNRINNKYKRNSQ